MSVNTHSRAFPPTIGLERGQIRRKWSNPFCPCGFSPRKLCDSGGMLAGGAAIPKFQPPPANPYWLMALSPRGQLSFHFTIREFSAVHSFLRVTVQIFFWAVIFSRAKKKKKWWRKRLLGQVVVKVWKQHCPLGSKCAHGCMCIWIKWPSNLMYILDAGMLPCIRRERRERERPTRRK